LLVGKTGSAFGTDGIELQATDNVWITKSGGNPLGLNRKGSDGSIIELYKDTGSLVGSIGTANGDLNINGDTGIRFQDTSIMPRRAGSDVDATVDIGLASHRWKDLYLSGGVYLGGTGAANKLDDYEEGTWTPNLTDSSNNSVSQSGQSGHYTKIGNMVYVIFGIQVSSISGAGNGLQIRNLPFQIENVTEGSGEPSGGALTFANSLQSRDLGGGIILRANNATNYIEMKYTAGGAQTTVGGINWNCSDISASTFMTGYCHYRAS